MYVFLDFEASSLAKEGYPIEVAWVFEDGASEAYLIRPAQDWTDWDAEAEAIHHITRPTLLADGVPHDQVARRMVERLGGHDLFASAPSWDGKWMSLLLRSAGLPRHALRLRDSEDAQRAAAAEVLAPLLQGEALETAVSDIVARAAVQDRSMAQHRALPDAELECQRWRRVRRLAELERQERARTAAPAPERISPHHAP